MSSPSNKSADTVSILKRLGIFDLLVHNPTLHQEREGRGPRIRARHEEHRKKPEIVHTQEQSHPVAGQRPQVSDRVRWQDEAKLQGRTVRTIVGGRTVYEYM